MEEKRMLQCETCIHKGICKNEERYKSAVDIWTRNEVDQNDEIVYRVTVCCPHQLTYSEIEYEIEMQKNYEMLEEERDDW